MNEYSYQERIEELAKIKKVYETVKSDLEGYNTLIHQDNETIINSFYRAIELAQEGLDSGLYKDC